MARSFGCALALTVLIVIPRGVLAQEVDPSWPPGIWIADASGELRPVPPEPATFLDQEIENTRQLVLSIESFGRTATGALSAGHLAAARVRRALLQTPVVTDRVSTELAFLEPRYRERLLAGSWERPRRVGYDAAFVITMDVPAGSEIGRLMDAALAAGATRVLALTPAERR